MANTSAPADFQGFLLGQALALLGPRPPATRDRFLAQARRLLAQTSDSELERVTRRVLQADFDWGYHPPEQLPRALHHAIADASLSEESALTGAENLALVRDKKLLLLPNHISFSDANVIEALLHRAGFDDICARLTVVAGPKVYGDPLRRFSSLCFGTIKVAQNAGRASGEAVMRPREVARLARHAIEATFERLDAGDAVLLFGEGTRSRDATLQSMLPGVARYCEYPDLWLLPMGITGSEQLMAFDQRELKPTRIDLRLGTPIEAAQLRAQCDGKRPQIAEAIGRAIAKTLPARYLRS